MHNIYNNVYYVGKGLMKTMNLKTVEKNIVVKISIIIPIYNCEKFLKRCVDSVRNQISINDEIILVNDGSTDSSLKICQEYQKKDNRVKVINKKNSGVSASRNMALEVAKGKYVCFLDSDDYLNEGYFKFIDEILEKYKDIEMINFGFFSDVDDENLKQKNSDLICYKEKIYENKEMIKADIVDLWDNTMLYNIWNKVYLKSIIDTYVIRFPKNNWGEDIEFNKSYMRYVSKMYNSNLAFYHYIRERAGATTKNYKPEIFNIRKKEFQQFNEYFDRLGIKKKLYYEFSCRRHIERVLGCIENVYCSDYRMIDRYKEIKKIINDSTTIETLKHAKPRSKKIKIMLIPIRLKLTGVTMMMGRLFNIVKNKFPAIFNRMKNRR